MNDDTRWFVHVYIIFLRKKKQPGTYKRPSRSISLDNIIIYPRQMNNRQKVNFVNYLDMMKDNRLFV